MRIGYGSPEPEVRWAIVRRQPARTVDSVAYSLEPCRLQYFAADIPFQAERTQLRSVCRPTTRLLYVPPCARHFDHEQMPWLHYCQAGSGA